MCPLHLLFGMSNNLIFVDFYIEHQIFVLWQNMGTLDQHTEFNEETISDALSAADTEDCYADIPDLSEDNFFL